MMREPATTQPGVPISPREHAPERTHSRAATRLDDPSATWEQRLEHIVEMMREMSSQTDPQAMVHAYSQRVRTIQSNDGFITCSRRGMPAPHYRITRATAIGGNIDPWREPHRLPSYDRGILGELLYADKPVLIQDFTVPPNDPAAHLFLGARSIAVIPQYDGGVALNMIVVLKKEPNGFDPERFPELVWQSNLFGRATSNLVLSRQLREAYDAADRELRVVADIQRSLLPTELPTGANLDIATHYQTSKNAGGDYFDFFRLPDGKVGMLIADVAGHGTPAAVLMAILHAIAHVNQAWQREHQAESAAIVVPPRQWMGFVNRQLAERYTRLSGTFVTAFYAVYDPVSRVLSYSSAGHNPPRLRLASCSPRLSSLKDRREKLLALAGESLETRKATRDDGTTILALDQAQGVPLGVLPEAEYTDTTITLAPGDVLTLYTDGITEAFNADREMFGVDRLEQILSRDHDFAAAYLAETLDAVTLHAGNVVGDDRTLLVIRVTGDHEGEEDEADGSSSRRADG